MKEYIDLSIRRYKDNRLFSLDEAISINEVIVLLGAPGSGKTSLLKKYAEPHTSDAEYIKIKKFLNIPCRLDDEAKVLLLDGLDEYRSISPDKRFVTTELGNRLNQLENKKIVISCREMDWFGEYDESALKDEIQKDAVVYGIEPLSDKQKEELAVIQEINNPQEFIAKFSNYGFLENPQMFVMLADLYRKGKIDSIGSKKDLYLTFVKNARERNPDYTCNRINDLRHDEILKYSGYLAAFNLFSGQDSFDEEFVSQIYDSEKGYPKEKLLTVLNTTLFKNKTFVHRTIAEFVLAYFLHEYKLKSAQSISLKRIKNLFVNCNKIPTELRGAYAWLCSLTMNDELIKVDPYYQAIHGDNSSFDNETKKRIVLQVKEYAKTDPYFFQSLNMSELEGFYNKELDPFFIEEFQDALRQKNHYLFFIVNAIVTTSELSSAMKDFLKRQIENGEVSSYCKSEIIDSNAFMNEHEFNLNVLTLIKQGKISDENDSLKNRLLTNLYPEHISSEEVADYLDLYSSDEMIHTCFYLFKTPYDEKRKLVDRIFQLSYDSTRSPHLKLPKHVEPFVSDYFMETVLRFGNPMTAHDIFNVIKHFKSNYYKNYKNLHFESFKHDDELKRSDDKLNRLANDLFSLYVDDVLQRENRPDIRWELYSFQSLFNLKSPQRASNILLDRLDSARDIEINKMLFSCALSYASPDNTTLTEELTAAASKFGFESLLFNWKNPPKADWEIEQEKWKEEQKEKKKKSLEHNETYFRERQDDELQHDFNALFFIAEYLYMEEEYDENKICLTRETFERLKSILKDAIFKDLIDPELLTIKSLAEQSSQAMRNIDTVYYVSCQLNKGIDIKQVSDELLKYLYINVLSHRCISSIIDDKDNARLIEKVEKNLEFVEKILKEYIAFTAEAHLGNHKDTIAYYIETEKDIEKLKDIAVLFVHGNNTIADIILNNFLNVYNFNIALGDLVKLDDESFSTENRNRILALRTLLEDKKDDFTVNMAISLYLLFRDRFERFSCLSGDKKVKIIDYMMSQFNTEEAIKFESGFQSSKQQCASFLNRKSLESLDEKELLELQNIRLGENDIWTNRIAHAISQTVQKNADQTYKPYGMEKVKNFILSGDILSAKDFFADILEKIGLLKQEIEDNRNNDKVPFKGRSENECRDLIMVRLMDKYGNDIELIREKFEGNNRTDINIKYRANLSFEVQIECKKDNNADIDNGIQNQLIGKYLSSGVQYGIYLVFYFGQNTKKEEQLQKELEARIPPDYNDKIKVICIDLN